MRKKKKTYNGTVVLMIISILVSLAVCIYTLPAYLREQRRVLNARFDEAMCDWGRRDYSKVLEKTDLNCFQLFLVRRPAKYLYWNAKAQEKTGGTKKAEEIKLRLLKKYPTDYYAFLIAPVTGGVNDKNKAALFQKAKKKFVMPYAKEVRYASKKTNISCALIWAIMKRESKFNPAAQSSSGACGLMQIMPVTAKYIAQKHKLNDIDIRKPEDNILLGAYQLKDLLLQFDGHFVFAVAAYNAGASNVNKWRAGYVEDDIWVEKIPYSETREFVRCVTENYELYKELLK